MRLAISQIRLRRIYDQEIDSLVRDISFLKVDDGDRDLARVFLAENIDKHKNFGWLYLIILAVDVKNVEFASYDICDFLIKREGLERKASGTQRSFEYTKQ